MDFVSFIFRAMERRYQRMISFVPDLQNPANKLGDPFAVN